MTILTKNTKFDDINIGDEVPSFEIEETQETMDKPQKNQWNLVDIGQREQEFPRGEQKIYIMMKNLLRLVYLVLQ